MPNSTNLGLPYIDANQNQKHVTLNTALQLLDALVQIQVQSAALSAPPSSPADGQEWIVAPNATGAWAGKDLQIAAWQSGAWTFLPPRAGYVAYNVATGATSQWTGTAWVPFGTGGGSGAVTSVAGRTGAVTLAVGDVAGAAPLAGPALTGVPTAPTAAAGTNTSQVATTSFVAASFVTFTFASANYATSANATLTGTPTAPTPAAKDNSTRLATTAYAERAAAAGWARTQVSDAAYTVLPTDRTVAVIALTAARILTLPAANAYPAGATLTVTDESGACSATSTITIAAAGSDTVNGGPSAVLSSPYGYLALESNTSNKWTVIDSPSGVVASLNGGPLAGNRNRIINGNFAINQRSYATGTAIAAALYAHDRWKAGASGCTYSFASTGIDTTATITAGTLTQVIEAANVEGGPYTLSWTGNATARVTQGAASGAYAASPIVVTGLASGASITVEFATGSLGQVQFETGPRNTPFERRPIGAELALCQRYYYRRVPGSNHDVICMMSAYSATQTWGKLFDFPVEMRVAPTLGVSAAADVQLYNAAGSPLGGCTAFLPGAPPSSTRSAQIFNSITAPAGAGFTAGQALFLTFTGTTGWIDATAEF